MTESVSSAARDSLMRCVERKDAKLSTVSARSGAVAICQPPPRCSSVMPRPFAYCARSVFIAASARSAEIPRCAAIVSADTGCGETKSSASTCRSISPSE